MSASVLLKAIGLNVQPNQLDPNSVPPGSLSVADNVIIRRDNVIESRRGYKLYGESFGSSSDRAKQLATYKSRILRHFASTLQYDTGTVDSNGLPIFNSFNGSYTEPQAGRRIRFIESNSNFYFTTSDGIKKISATSASDFTTNSGFITQAGGVKALDVTARLNLKLGNNSGFLQQDSAVAYRILWNITDANNNLVPGTPSQRAVITNPLINLLLKDYNNLLGALDNVSNASPASLISDGNYVSLLNLPITASATTLLNNLVTLSAKIDVDILYADQVAVAPLQLTSASISGGVATITFSSGDPRNYLSTGSKIILSGFTATTGTLNIAQTVSTTTSTTITFNTTATGPVTLASATINSNTFRNLTAPSTPSVNPTDSQLVAIQGYISQIISNLQLEPSTGSPATISSASQSAYISGLITTTTTTVFLDITIPPNVTTDYFYQVYRSPQSIATGSAVVTDVSPSDELQLVFEGFPTSANISAGHIVIEDITPDAFRGANLYTNATTGDGILQANDIPPAAKDIARFKNYTFYGNTRTKHRLDVNLLGVANMISDYNSGKTPKILITDGIKTNVYQFATGLQEITSITTVAGSSLNNSGTANYFTINSAQNLNQYYFWYKIGTAADPAIAGKTGVSILALAGDTNTTIANRTRDALNILNSDFTASASTNHVTVTTVGSGVTTDATNGTSGFTVLVTQQGRGEDFSSNTVLLSSSVSPAIAVDETARSLVRVINHNTNEAINALYISGTGDIPGQMLFEERTLTNTPFYVLGNNSNTGLSFNPDISPEATITNISIANPTIVTTNVAHNLLNMDQVLIVSSNSTPSIDGLSQVTFLSGTTFSIPINVTVGGNAGAIHRVSTAVVSDNEILPNRIYFSKFLQPEAVPIVNTIDVGAKDKQILRLFALRDSLFVFKEDGLFRISGESSPFTLALFDSSVIVLPPDAVDASNNLIYCWTTKGIQQVSEAGVDIISRPIDIDLLKLATSDYPSFLTATWGIGYESDNSYTVYTLDQTTDTIATIAYRYSTLTNSWTTFSKTATCGIVNSADDKQYLGAGDTNFIEQERKDFTRLDYSDREISLNINANTYFGNQIVFSTTNDIEVGDVLVQQQLLSLYDYNVLLKKLDTDSTTGPHNYFSTLQFKAGLNLRTAVDSLLSKIAADPTRTAQSGATSGASYLAYQSIGSIGTITAISAANPTIITCTSHGLQTGRIISISGTNSTPSIDGVYAVTVTDANHFSIPVSVSGPGTTGSFQVQNQDFRDILASFNGMINLMNLDSGITFTYDLITNVAVQEAIVTDVVIINNATKTLVLNATLDFINGPVILFKSIPTTVVWAPQTFGDSLGLKHLREFTLMFENKAFSDAIMSFSTDLLPRFIPVPFNGDGNGIFGYSGGSQGFGTNFFGGTSNSAPFRTLIPRDCQRCRYIVCQFTHSVAREQYSIFGLSLTGEISQSTRAYR